MGLFDAVDVHSAVILSVDHGRAYEGLVEKKSYGNIYSLEELVLTFIKYNINKYSCYFFLSLSCVFFSHIYSSAGILIIFNFPLNSLDKEHCKLLNTPWCVCLSGTGTNRSFG